MKILVILFPVLFFCMTVSGSAERLEEPLSDTAVADVASVDTVFIDEAALLHNGIRKIQGKQITVYTDLPNRKDVDELPEVFAQFIPLCCRFFFLDEKNFGHIHIECFLIDNFDKFKSSGAVAQVPKLKNGYALRNRIWLRNQSTAYYLRHLFLHECVHALTGFAFGSWGPPWYREGTAELLATHRWENGKLTLGVFPKEPADFPRWGRIEYVQQSITKKHTAKEFRQHFRTVADILHLAADDYNENEPYAWSWAFAAFCANHSSYNEPFRQTARHLSDNYEKTEGKFLELIRRNEPNQTAEIELCSDWLDFQKNICYGYDFKRSKIEYPQKEVPVYSERGKITVKTDCNWQSSGLQLKKGNTYTVTAAGRFQIRHNQIGGEPKLWLSEPNGITVKYYGGVPLGMLTAAVIPERELRSDEQTGIGFHRPLLIGLEAEFTAPETGVLFFKINDVPSELEDNSGTVSVSVSEK